MLINFGGGSLLMLRYYNLSQNFDPKILGMPFTMPDTNLNFQKHPNIF